MFLFLQYDSSPLIAATATVQILLVLVLVLVIGRLVGFKAVTADI
jgi:putative spermidine/putrescine transport system permease protein